MFNIMNFLLFISVVSLIENQILIVNALNVSPNDTTHLTTSVIDDINNFLINVVLPIMNIKPPREHHENTVELIENMGFTAQTHCITTIDGYVIEMHRINSIDDAISADYPPILLQHGLFDTSSNWLINTCNQSLGYILASAGFDVWLSNVRGNKYGRQHLNLSRESNEFWDYNLDDLAQKDLTAAIDYVLEATNRTQINYIAHSMGTTLALILLATQPQYNKKIKTFYAISPIAFVHHARSPLVKAIVFYYAPQTAFWSILGSNNQFFTEGLRRLSKILCTLNVELCAELIGQVSGPNLKEIRMCQLPTFLHYMTGGTSVKTVIHFTQLYTSKLFRPFDFGMFGNLLTYKQTTPPEYPLKNINTPTVFLCGLNDYVSDIEDVKILSKRLPNHKKTIIIEDSDWGHADFLIAKHARELAFERLREMLLEKD